MIGMFSTETTVFFKIQTIRCSRFILCRRIVPVFTGRAFQLDDRSHIFSSLVQAHNQNRTDDLLLTMEMLYQLSYVGRVKPFLTQIENKAGDGARTRDPQLGRLMLYQLSYSRETKPLYFFQSSERQRHNLIDQKFYFYLFTAIYLNDET